LEVNRTSGNIYVRSQVQDYEFRGEEFEDVSFFKFILETYEQRISTQEHNERSLRYQAEEQNPTGDDRDRTHPIRH